MNTTKRKAAEKCGSIETTAFTLALVNGDLVATHKQTGVQVPVSIDTLERWLLRKLREMF